MISWTQENSSHSYYKMIKQLILKRSCNMYEIVCDSVYVPHLYNVLLGKYRRLNMDTSLGPASSWCAILYIYTILLCNGPMCGWQNYKNMQFRNSWGAARLKLLKFMRRICDSISNNTHYLYVNISFVSNFYYGHRQFINAALNSVDMHCFTNMFNVF